MRFSYDDRSLALRRLEGVWSLQLSLLMVGLHSFTCGKVTCSATFYRKSARQSILLSRAPLHGRPSPAATTHLSPEPSLSYISSMDASAGAGRTLS